VKGQLFSPLDKKLKLRPDQWSGGLARIVTRQGLLGKSFAQAAEAISDAVGCAMNRESVRQITQAWGSQVETSRQEMANQLFAAEIAEPEMPALSNPIEKQASISTDGGMILIRNEGWKEVKLVAISSVRPKTASERSDPKGSRRYAPWEPQMMLADHSYQAGLWEADTAGQHQYVEALRRGVPECLKVSAVADGAGWIERITTENFPDAVQIVDWFHLTEKMWFIGKHYYPDQAQREIWVNQQLDALWQGRTRAVISALAQLSPSSDAQVNSALGYVERQQERMAYHRYRVAGYPIGSGCVESGINTVVHHRLKTQGRGWERDNAQAMLAALSELHSRRFMSAWQSVN
jgi:hypothetical protein